MRYEKKRSKCPTCNHEVIVCRAPGCEVIMKKQEQSERYKSGYLFCADHRGLANSTQQKIKDQAKRIAELERLLAELTAPPLCEVCSKTQEDCACPPSTTNPEVKP